MPANTDVDAKVAIQELNDHDVHEYLTFALSSGPSENDRQY